MFALCPQKMLIDDEFQEGLAVLIEGDCIAAVIAADDVPSDVICTCLGDATLAPGFIDVQVNGGGDVLFNDDPSVAAIRRIGLAHRAYGTTGFLPTLISDDLEVIRAGVAAVDAAIDEGVPGVLGIHIEGPFINVARKGIHDALKIRELDEEGFAVLTSLRRGRTLVTLAPEIAGPAMIGRLAAAGVIVSAGHTAGTYEQARAGIAAGLSGFTHLFNAMSPLTGREPGAVGAGLYHDDVWCSLIVDGHHVDPVTLKLALRCKPADRIMLVSDAMPPTGGCQPDFVLNGRLIATQNGRLIDEDGVLAGADLNMLGAVRMAAASLDVPLSLAHSMASTHPAAFLGLGDRLGRIAPGYRACLIAIGQGDMVDASWIDGRATSAV